MVVIFGLQICVVQLKSNQAYFVVRSNSSC
jgi:hypothetical protein